MKKGSNFFIIVLLIGIIVAFAYWIIPSFFTPKTATEEQARTDGDDRDGEEGVVCIQVITPARNPDTGDIREFSTPCDVPEGWETIQNDIPDLESDVQSDLR